VFVRFRQLPNHQQTFVVSLLNVKIFRWLRFLVLMRDIESKKLEKKLFLQIHCRPDITQSDITQFEYGLQFHY